MQSTKLVDDLVAKIEDYCASHKMTWSRFGRNVNGTQELVKRLRAGSLRLSTVRQIETWLKEHK